MTLEEIKRLVGDFDIANNIFSAMVDVRRYTQFESTMSLGLTMDANTIPFERLMVFGWIKGIINERKS